MAARPREAERPAPEPEGSQSAAVEAQACLARLHTAGFQAEAAETPPSSNDRCRIDAPVRLKSVPVPSRPEASVVLKEQPILACRFAEAYGQWLGGLVAPMMAGVLRTDLKAVRTGPGFECRNRNRAATGKLSAHAEGLAIDMAGFELADGSTLSIKEGGGERTKGVLDAVRRAGCGWFTTILGPGSDAAHADHLHVDLQQHGSSDRYRICQ